MKPADISLPAPLTPADCDLRDFAFMPLDVVRLRDSDLAVTAEADEFRCAVLLWCASWHQVPAASLPDDDKVLAQYAGYGRVVKEWQKVRDGALRGWVKCADGRLYHPVVAEKANEAWLAKLRQRLKTECARIKKHNERHKTSIPFPDFDAWMEAGCPVGQPLFVPSDNPPLSQGQGGSVTGENHSKGQGEGQGQGQLTTKTLDSDPRSTAQTESGAGDGIEPTPVGLLSKAMRAFGINSNPGDLRLIALAGQGVTVESVQAACEAAKKAKPNESIPTAYVLSILERWAKEAAELKAAGATPPHQLNGHARAEPFDPVAHVNRNRRTS
jgi:hypothetical protein